MAAKSPARVFIIAMFVEVILAAIGVFLVMQIQSGAIRSMTTPQELITRITTVIGGAMGLFLVLFIWLYQAAIKTKRHG